MHSVVDAFINRNSPQIPGLRLLFDTNRLAQLIQQHSSGRIDRLRLQPIYVRFKPRTSCIVSYRIDSELGACTCYAKAIGRLNRVKLEKAMARRVVDCALGAGSMILPEDLVSLWFFPNDLALRGISKLLSGDVPVAVLAHKPERRFVGLAKPRDGHPSIVKICDRATFPRAQALAGIANQIPLLPDLIAVDEARSTLFLKWIAGRTLAECIRGGDTSPNHFHAAGKMLARFHRTAVPSGVQLRTQDDDAVHLHSIATGMRELLPHLFPAAEKINRQLQARLHSVGQQRMLVHGDFYANQVLITDKGIRLLDSDELHLSHAESDIGLFLAHLQFDVLCGHLTQYQCDALQQAFLDGYRAERAYSELRRVVYTLFGMWQLAHRPFRDLMEGWPQLIERWTLAIEQRLVELNRLYPAAVADNTGTDDNGAPLLTEIIRRAISPHEGCKLVAHCWSSNAVAAAPLQVHSANLLRSKPGKRALIGYRTSLQPSGSKFHLVGKIRHKGLDDKTFLINQALYRCVRRVASQGPLRIPRPLFTLAELRMWMQEWIEGADGWSGLNDGNATQTAHLIGSALRQLHDIEIPLSRTHTINDEMAMLAQRLALVGSASPKLHERLDRLTQKCRALAGTLRSRPQCGIHRDFYPDQLVVVDRQVYLLDLDLYSRGDPALDLGNFIAHVNENDLRRFGDPNRSSGLMQVLIDAYAGAHCDEQLRYAVAVYRVLSLARHIHISTLFSERSKFSEEILAWCESDTASLMRRRGMHMTSLERPQ
ncbi:MAG: phosphotransferase [Gammaproteobacteria bacterium]|nr:phosphotransferase [Gammaproteobacteria bacterium]